MKRYAHLSIFLFAIVACDPKVKDSIDTWTVKRGEFHIEVVETGEIEAIEAINISSPAMSWRFGQLKITKIIEDGAEVAKGDTVILFDPSEVEKAIVNAKADLEISEAEFEKLKAEQESKIYELEADLKMADLSHQISRLELEQAIYEPDIKKKEIELNLDKAKISLDKAGEEIGNQKKIHLEEQQQSIVKIRQLKDNLEDANKTLRALTVISPTNGVAVLRKNWSTGKKFQVGDQTWSGNPLIDLPNLSGLKVQTQINEIDISKIQLDQKSEIRMDAFSDTVFTGNVTQIAALAKYKDDKEESKIKIFPVDIFLNGTSKKLMPGMTVSCKIIVGKIDSVLCVPLEAIHSEEGEDFVYLKSGSSFKKNKVKIGQANNDYIIIEDGLKEENVVALSDPFVKNEFSEPKKEI